MMSTASKVLRHVFGAVIFSNILEFRKKLNYFSLKQSGAKRCQISISLFFHEKWIIFFEKCECPNLKV